MTIATMLRTLSGCVIHCCFLYNKCLQTFFSQIKESGDTRIVVDGQPGSGKTTFVKRICYLWAERFQQAGDGKVKRLEDHSLVLPIILKFINTENNLTDILTSQFNCLNICEICALLKHQEENPKDTLLLLDGFDEYTGKSFVENVILKKECSDILCITTSRSHAIEQIKRHSSQAVQQHIRLCQFSEDQVKTYIEQFCEYHGLSQKTGEDLMKTLEKRADLLEVAKIPMRTEMICVVWAVFGRLGDTLADLYEKFVLHLITHWDEKIPTSSQFVNLSENEIWKSNQPLLLKVGKLANTWTKQNILRSTFSDNDLENVLETDDCQKLIEIGLLTKSYPSSTVQASKWSFPHLTFQEYFIAYLLGNDTNGDYITNFIVRCKQHNYRVLSKYELMFTFLASKQLAKANTIMTQLLLDENVKSSCEELFDIICKHFQHFVCQATDMPLPCYLNLESRKHLYLTVLNTLFKADQRRKKSNLRYLSVDKPKKFENFLNILHIEELKVRICSEDELELVNRKIKHLCHLTSLTINSSVSFFLPDNYNILKSIQYQKLKYFSITGHRALEVVARHIHSFTSLEMLEVDENSSITDNTNGHRILSVLKGNKLMKEIHFSVMDLHGIIVKEDVETKVIVHVKKLQGGTLKNTSDMLTEDSTVALHTLDLCRNNLQHEGGSMGELVAKLTQLWVLSLADCNLKPKTIMEMVDAMTKVEAFSNLHTLNMGQYENHNRNKLHSAGSALGKLIKQMPELEILDLEECKLTSNDFDAMSDEISGSSTKVHTLNIGVNDLGEANQGGFRFLQYMPELEALKAGGYSSEDPIPAICGAVDTGDLNKLSILDVSDSSVKSENLVLLSENLPLMRCLKSLNLKGLEGVKLKDYNGICENIPSSLTYLNLSSRQNISKESPNPYDILNNKHRISQLLRFNITLTKSDLGLLQELLEEINPDIKVYNSEEENIWETYVLDKMNS